MSVYEERNSDMGELLHIERTGAYELAIAGELDIATGDELALAISQLRHGSKAAIVLDVSGLTFVDSTGLSSLVHSRDDGEVSLRRPQQTLLRVIQMCGLEDVFSTVA